jgi:hypothetical protein
MSTKLNICSFIQYAILVTYFSVIQSVYAPFQKNTIHQIK